MLREIKFRAWDKELERMLYIKRLPDIGIMFNGEPVFDDGYRETIIDKWIDNYELMQYTGLHDKNGKEIYEGDILKIDDSLMCDVVFENGSFQIKTNQHQGISALCQERAGRLECVGNIHENPELLEVKE